MRRALTVLLTAGLVTWFGVTACRGQAPARQRLRVATYNIRDLEADVSAARLANLREVLERLDADLIGLQEIGDRATLARVLPPDEWTIVLDDQGDRLNLAVAVRRPYRVVSLAAPYDAGDEQFLFEGPASEPFYLYGRDLLAVEVGLPGGSVWVLVHHAKSRVGGRHLTDWQRCGAAALLVGALQRDFAGRQVILLGDFNDNPDDQSLNILETGNWAAGPGPEPGVEGSLMANLCQPLVEQDRVSWGLNDLTVAGGRINTRVPGSRERNHRERFGSGSPQPILFDQILVSANVAGALVRGSVKVFDDPVALAGGAERASDHLPVLADFALQP